MSQSLHYRPDVDGLRAVAVLSVVLCHASLGFPGGYVGVDVFFVISGFLIASLIRKEQQAGTFSWGEFWLRRIRRLTPALVVVTAAVIVGGWFWMLPEDYANLGRSAKALFLLRPNVHFMFVSSYFDRGSASKPLLHTWSLGVEEQFYLVVPLGMWLLARVRRPALQAVILAVVLMASLAGSIYGTRYHPVGTFYLMPTRAWEFLTGMLLAWIPVSQTAGRSWFRELASLTGLAAILIPGWIYDDKTVFPGLAALPPVLGSALLIWAGGRSVPRPFVNQLLAWKPAVFIGLISYSVYLWHWPLIMFVKYRSAMPLQTIDLVGLVAGSLVLGAISWKLIETPFRTKWLLPTRFQLLAGTAVAVAPIMTASVILYSRNGFENRIPPEAGLFAATGTAEKDWLRYMAAEDIPEKMLWYGDRSKPADLLVWGDSHAAVTLPAIESWCQRTGVNACVATRPGTVPIVGYCISTNPTNHKIAVDLNDAVMTHLRSAKIPAVLLIAHWKNYLTPPGGIPALLKTIDDLNALGIRVYMMKEVPTFPMFVPLALVRYTIVGRDLRGLALPDETFETVEQFYDELRPKLLERGVTVLDPVPQLRAGDSSGLILPYNSGGSLYIDGGHLSPHGAHTLEPIFAPVFESIRRPSP